MRLAYTSSENTYQMNDRPAAASDHFCCAVHSTAVPYTLPIEYIYIYICIYRRERAKLDNMRMCLTSEFSVLCTVILIACLSNAHQICVSLFSLSLFLSLSVASSLLLSLSLPMWISMSVSVHGLHAFLLFQVINELKQHEANEKCGEWKEKNHMKRKEK